MGLGIRTLITLIGSDREHEVVTENIKGVRGCW